MRERAFRLSADKTLFIRNQFGKSKEIATEIGIKTPVFSLYLQGKRHIPETILMALCRATSKKPSDFLANPAEKIIADQA